MKKLYFLIYLVQISYCSFSQKANWTQKPFERKAFIENKGQFNNTMPSEFQNFEYAIDNGTKILFNKNKLVYCFTKSKIAEFAEEERGKSRREKLKESPENEREKFKSDYQYITMNWVNSNPNAYIVVDDKSSVDYGYLVKKENSEKDYQTTHCNGYKKLTIKNLYRGVDAEYFFNEKEGFKYNLILSPNADLSQIKLEYVNAKKIVLLNNEIHIKTIVGDLIEHEPISFLATDNNQLFPTSFLLNHNEALFNIPNYSNQKIIIDPWVTVPGLSGAPPVDNGVDQYGNTYVSGPNYILEKYSPTGTLLFSTNVNSPGFAIWGDMLSDSRGKCFF